MDKKRGIKADPKGAAFKRTNTIDVKHKKKIENQDAKHIPLHKKNINQLSYEQKQENLKNLHLKSKLLLKNNLERKKVLNCNVNNNCSKPTTSPIKTKDNTNENNKINHKLQKSTFIENKNLNNDNKTNSADLIQSKPVLDKHSFQICPNIYSTQKLFDYPYNFISAVKNKLSMTVNSPRRKNSKLTISPFYMQNGEDHNDNQMTVASMQQDKNTQNVSNVLKTSEIQNLTLSISFNDIRACQCSAPNISNNNNVVLENYEEKVEALSESPVVVEDKKSMPMLTPPNCILTPSKCYNPEKEINQENVHFHKELNLLDSFNESLNHIRKIDEALLSIRKTSQQENARLYFPPTHTTRGEELNSSFQSERKVSTRYQSLPTFPDKKKNLNISLTINPALKTPETTTSNDVNTMDFTMNSSDNFLLHKKHCADYMESCLQDDKMKKENIWKANSKSFVGHLCKFCICLISQNIEDEKSRLEYLTTFLKVRERTLVDAARTELLCLEVQKKQFHNQVPLLKKKQRGLLLKLQQERYEIKHIKKFHLTKSQERKEALRRQLKHLKILLVVDAYNSNRKHNRVRKSTPSITLPESPLKGVNLNSSLMMSDKIEEKHGSLAIQKKKMNDLLLHYYNLQIDSLELDALEKRINLEKESLQNKMHNILESKKHVEHMKETVITNFGNGEKVLKQSKICGSKLNELWKKITGNENKKYDDLMYYEMSESDMEKFFSNAKEIAYKSLLGSLETKITDESKKSSENNCVSPEPIVTQPEASISNYKAEYTTESDSSDSTAHSLIEELKNFPNELSNSTEGNSEIPKIEIIPSPQKNADDNTSELKPRESSDVTNMNANKTRNVLQSERSKLLSSSNFAKFDSFLQEREGLHQESLTVNRWEGTSPSPELSPHDSASGEYSPAFAAVTLALSRNEEAEELRKKQLAIEREIKALEQQQSQIPYCLVREIPDKPPPPYIPPTEEPKPTTVIVARPVSPVKEPIPLKPTDQVINMISTMCNWIWSQLANPSNTNVRDYNTFLNYIRKKSIQTHAIHSMLLFDLCNEKFESEYKLWHSTVTEPWEYQEKKPLACRYNTDLCKAVEVNVKKILNINSPKDNALVKSEDHVEKLSIKELYEEEVHWGNVEKYEIEIKNELTNSILQSLVMEAIKEYKSTFVEIGTTV